MKRRRITGLLTAMTVLSMCVTGCGGAATANAPAATKEAAPAEAEYTETAPATESYDDMYDDEWAEAAAEEYGYDEEYETVDTEAVEYTYDGASEEAYINTPGAMLQAEAASYDSSAEYDETTQAEAYYDEAYGDENGEETVSWDRDEDRKSAGSEETYRESRKDKSGKKAKAAGRDDYLGQIYDYSCFPAGFNTEEYSKLEEQGYRSVLNRPLSTFAADVDTASYSNLRRMLNDGYSVYDLPSGSVRVEELLNYFNYDYAGPKGSDPFGVNFEMSECPWNEDAKLMSIGLKTEDIDFEETPASNLVFLIDVSGSMSDPDKLPLLQEAFCMLADQLTDKDRVSIVTYASGVKTVLKGAKGNESRRIKEAINDLRASGGTNGGKGIELAYELAEKNFIKGGNNRVLLATDGDLNLGITSVGGLEQLITEKKESGVFLSVLGFGTGNIKDNRMETLADKGNGNYSYIDSVKEAKKVLVDELSSNMLTVCKDVKLQVEFNPAVVKGYRLVGYANRTMKAKDFNDDKKDGGEIGAGHEVTALYELILTEDMDALDDDAADVSELRYADEFRKAGKSSKKNGSGMSYTGNEEIMTLSVRYKKPSENKSNLLTYPVTFKYYEASPSDNFIFQSAVAEFGLIASHSEYQGNADLDRVADELESIRLNDEYKREFRDMVEEAY
ncbi:MAG: VWA domain-containing protein [Lachnospiraceae bacterium]|nr:VWA domain-containing protein [Lachnospiraceae bacterium]